MQKLRCDLSEDIDSYLISCQKCDVGNLYIVKGLTSTFCYKDIMSFNNTCMAVPKSSCNGYVALRVYSVFCSQDGKYIQTGMSDSMRIDTEFSDITLSAIRSFTGGAISFRSDKHYDKYKLYCLADDYDSSIKSIIETEDCLVVDDCVLPGRKFCVEGYTRTDTGMYKLSAKSDMWTCEYSDQVSDLELYISVVIPVYNCDVFLPRTIDSVLLSTMHNIEIILVDDGSDDNSALICDWYASHYVNIKVFHETNKGVCHARNQGMDMASCEFLAFMDNDDIVHPYMYEKLYGAVHKYNTDIAIAQTIMRDDFEKSQLVLRGDGSNKDIVMNSYQEVIAGKGSLNNIYFVAIWNKIIRTSVARQVRFNEELTYYEDTAYTSSIYTYIKKFVCVSGAYYVWDKRKQKTLGTASTTHYNHPGEVIWKYYILSYAAPLFTGNQSDISVMADVKFDIIKNLLAKYSEQNFIDPTKSLIAGMIKYLVKHYDLPAVKLLIGSDEDKKLYSVWNDIEHSDVIEYDGHDDIPKEYYHKKN